MNWVQEDYTRGSKTILEVKSQFPSMLVPAACFHDFWCAKYEYCMATRYLPVGRMVTKAIRPTEGTKIIFVSSCVGLLCHLSWHLPASGNHPSHQRWLWRWWRRGLHQLIDEDPDFFPAGVGENPILVTLPTGSHTMTWLVQLKWRDLRSSLTVPWQLHSIHCSQDERGAALRRVKKTMFRKSSPSTWGGGNLYLESQGTWRFSVQGGHYVISLRSFACAPQVSVHHDLDFVQVSPFVLHVVKIDESKRGYVVQSSDVEGFNSARKVCENVGKTNEVKF